MLRRFLDDVLLKWKLSLGNPEDLLSEMNSFYPKINFIMEKGRSLPFLDVRFTLNPNNSLSTDIYYKETDTHNYVPFYCYHPHKTLTNIPFSLARRICAIVSDPVIRDQRLQELQSFLRKKQYPDLVISSGMEQARSINRQSLLQPQLKPTEDIIIPFVFTHNGSNPQVLDTVRQSSNLLAPSKRMTAVMKDKRIVAARRQPPNIKSMLFRPRFESSPPFTRGSVLPCRKDPNRKAKGRPCMKVQHIEL
jgi:hypothetical protein